MQGPDLFSRPRGGRRGAALSLVFASILLAGAAGGSWDVAGEAGASDRRPLSNDEPAGADSPRDLVAAAEEAVNEGLADGKSGAEAAQAAEEVVSRSGDRWATVYDADEYEEFRKALDGEYTGVGLWAKRSADGCVEVARVRSGGPADKAGIRPGDRILAIDGKDVGDLPVTEVLARLRGESATGSGTVGAGSSVVLGLRRDGRTWTETLRRARIDTESVTVDRDSDGVTHITVARFTTGSGEKVRRAVRSAPEGRGVLLDLRGNSGGLVTEAVVAASAFLDGGLVATYDMRGEQRALYAEGEGDTQRPLVTLVDGGTMSAAELLTGALQDRGRSVVVGSRTFGKGSVQMPTELPDGSVAELTVGHYRTPAGRTVDGVGITPDLPVDSRAEERARTVLSGLGTPS
ncbi:S41 family peptidase [Streptomyces sp. GC420]|uniref:S41 family peptidase n=1 Tax=Streptomyces sp. GC420 TaxID=2697568 RepID=UPI0014152FAF|nr:S41 family peptidase [Streptomyces sp. GC420]NBM20068.1 PDZ domain-containing protein [Streptomyces sp. GC420]